jgi:hypothetical protein
MTKHDGNSKPVLLTKVKEGKDVTETEMIESTEGSGFTTSVEHSCDF